MAERGFGRVAHGTHGIHGKGEGGGRKPGELPANCANEREWRRGESEEWPAGYTDDTERGTEIGTTETETDFLTTKDTKGGGRIVVRETEAGENSGAGGRRT